MSSHLDETFPTPPFDLDPTAPALAVGTRQKVGSKKVLALALLHNVPVGVRIALPLFTALCKIDHFIFFRSRDMPTATTDDPCQSEDT